ncbi:MAG: methylated-DNA--[protein]-cysteine S-methyltransferase [bacterium]|nr:methylated-DNA--[protein]-cysteine S-methyltransferase [bacterium]
MTTESEIVDFLSQAEDVPAAVERGTLIRTALADQYTTVPGPLGIIHVGFTPHGVSSIVPTASEQEFLDAHASRVGRRAFRGELPDRLATRLEKVLGSGRLGKLPVDLRVLTSFQQDVLEVTASIPPGEVRPYGWVARELGNKGAVRAVGSALARNPIPIAIPCHRVVKSDGAIGNYAFGPPMKQSLLEHEGMTEFGKMRLIGSGSTGIFCYPTCRHAKRITAKHRLEFPSAQRAEAAGFRGCKVCRPV